MQRRARFTPRPVRNIWPDGAHVFSCVTAAIGLLRVLIAALKCRVSSTDRPMYEWHRSTRPRVHGGLPVPWPARELRVPELEPPDLLRRPNHPTLPRMAQLIHFKT